jgi:hypothetical protein
MFENKYILFGILAVILICLYYLSERMNRIDINIDLINKPMMKKLLEMDQKIVDLNNEVNKYRNKLPNDTFALNKKSKTESAKESVYEITHESNWNQQYNGNQPNGGQQISCNQPCGQFNLTKPNLSMYYIADNTQCTRGLNPLTRSEIPSPSKFINNKLSNNTVHDSYFEELNSPVNHNKDKKIKNSNNINAANTVNTCNALITNGTSQREIKPSVQNDAPFIAQSSCFIKESDDDNFSIDNDMIKQMSEQITRSQQYISDDIESLNSETNLHNGKHTYTKEYLNSQDRVELSRLASKLKKKMKLSFPKKPQKMTRNDFIDFILENQFNQSNQSNKSNKSNSNSKRLNL